MLKIILSKDEYDALPDVIRLEYKDHTEGRYILNTDQQFEDVSPLKTALEHEKQNRLSATTKLTATEKELADLRAASGGNMTALEKSWEAKLTKAVEEEKAKIKDSEKAVRKVLVDNVVSDLATRVNADFPDLVIPHIKDRITLERRDDGEYITRILDANGKASALSVNEFFAEIVANEKLAPIVKVNRSSGSGARGNFNKGVGDKTFDQLSETEKTTLFRENRPEYDRLKSLRNQ